ncbi:fused DSP-PTPase phosphatase/NAD kinase-like protein [Halovulum sp. GXIMD14794]
MTLSPSSEALTGTPVPVRDATPQQVKPQASGPPCTQTIPPPKGPNVEKHRLCEAAHAVYKANPRHGWFLRRYCRWRHHWAHDMAHPRARLYAYCDLHFSDHGFVRAIWTNRDEVAPGIWRSNQPSPRQLRWLSAQGLRTVLNLRGATSIGAYALERETCAEEGLRLIDFKMTSRALPTVEQIHGLRRIFETAERPLLMHCKSGADRAGIASALFLLFNGASAEDAARQLSLRYLHLDHSKTGILDHFVECYRQFDARTPTPFMDWVDNHYDPDALNATFKPSGPAEFLNSTILRRE